jgi:polyisoprenoid-binding protein YceI
MKKLVLSSILFVSIASFLAFIPIESKLKSAKSHIKFFSTTAAEDIEAHNYKAVSTIDTQSGKVVFSVPMQSFEFEKSLMQKHFNQSKFLDTKQFPKAKFVGNIQNLKEISFDKDGTYLAKIEGQMTIRGKTNTVVDEAKLTVKEGLVKVLSSFDLKLADYGIEFEKGKPSKNIAETVKVTIEAEYPNL